MDILSGLSLIVSIIIGIWGIYQTHITNQLQQDVNRLSVRLDQSIQRLERVRDLVNNISISCQTLVNKIHATESVQDSDIAQAMTVTRASLHELKALSKVIGDERLKEAVQQLEHNLTDIKPSPKRKAIEESLSAWLQWISGIEATVEKLHERVYTLLDDTTQNEKQS